MNAMTRAAWLGCLTLIGWHGLAQVPAHAEGLQAAAGRGEESIWSRYSSEDLNAQNNWFVSTPVGLNCRARASVNSDLVYGALPRFTPLVAFDLVGRRGVFAEGLHWLRVLPRGPAYPEPCFVAADSRYIQAEYPDATLVGSLTQIPGDVTCPTFAGTANRIRLVSRSFIAYLCGPAEHVSPVGSVQTLLVFRRNEPRDRLPILKLSDPEFDPAGGGQFIFRNGDSMFLVDLPSFRYPSSFLSVINADKSGYDELILEWLD